MENIEVIREDLQYLYIRLAYIPSEYFSDCINVFKKFYGKYFPDEKSWRIEKHYIKQIIKEVIDILENNKYENNDNTTTNNNIIFLINNFLQNEKDENKRLEKSNNLIKFLRGISIDLNKKIYKEQ